MKKIFKKDYIRVTTDNKWVLVYILTAFMAGLLTAGTFIKAYDYFKSINQPTELLSPLVGALQPPKVYAKESISCENPRGYLECQVYKGIITWEDHDKLSRIIQCESRWNPEAINKNTNGTYDLGLFQINTVHSKKINRIDSLDFKKNLDFGIAMFKKQGASPWRSSIKCHGVK